MTKIRSVLLWLLFSPLFSLGQIAHSPTERYFTNQPVFIVHLLTDQVDPENKRPYERSIKGRPVSLPCPTQCQQPRRLC